LVSYTDEFLEMFPSNDKLTKFVCDTSSVLTSSDNIIYVSSSHDIQYVQFIEIIEWYINANWIFILGDIKWRCNVMKI